MEIEPCEEYLEEYLREFKKELTDLIIKHSLNETIQLPASMLSTLLIKQLELIQIIRIKADHKE